jgi:hypothetical protein
MKGFCGGFSWVFGLLQVEYSPVFSKSLREDKMIRND